MPQSNLTSLNWWLKQTPLLLLQLIIISPVNADNTGYQGDQYTTNTYGGIGLLQVPTARFSQDGEFAFGLSHETPFNRLYGRMQFLPWLEGVVRYTEGQYKAYYLGSPQSFKDKGIDLKIKLFNETETFPQIAIGLLDLGGTGVDSSEYLVASKQIKNVDYTFGIGWGALGGKAHISNPLSLLSDSFDFRRSSDDLGGLLILVLFLAVRKLLFLED